MLELLHLGHIGVYMCVHYMEITLIRITKQHHRAKKDYVFSAVLELHPISHVLKQMPHWGKTDSEQCFV